ncbi:MAG: patatin-like phospholipase family protein [Alphaproteobacteria bacterium]
MAFRILSLDGGGSWALIEVRALIDLYDNKTTGHKVLSDFDLVAANSGGSLVLGGLVEDLPLGDLLGYFEDETKRKSIFSPVNSLTDWAVREVTGLGPKYSEEAKLHAIEQLLPKSGDVLLTAAAAGVRRNSTGKDVHLLIIGFDYDRNRAKFFRSAPAGGGPTWGEGAPADVTLAEAIHASANPPVNYFDKPATFPVHPGRYWDGGIAGCNNPVLAAVTEALALEQAPKDIAALSLGTATVILPLRQTGDPASPYTQPPTDQGLVTDIGKLARSILDDPPDIASYLAYVMTGAAAPSRVVRMNPLISPLGTPGNWRAPTGMTASRFTYLANLDMDAVEQPQVNAIANLADSWLQGNVRNQPIRMNGDTLVCELGSEWFSDAVAAWRKIK